MYLILYPKIKQIWFYTQKYILERHKLIKKLKKFGFKKEKKRNWIGGET